MLSHVQLFTTAWTAARQASLSITISLTLLKLMSIESVISFNHLLLCHPLPSISPTIRVFSNKSTLCIGLAKVLELRLQHQSFQSIFSVDDTTLMTESEEELKSFLMKVKEESEKTLKLNIQKTKIMASDPIFSWQIDWHKVGTVSDFMLFSSKIRDCSHKIKIC